MILDLRSASAFIAGYKRLLLEIDGPRRETRARHLLHALVSARRRLSKDPALVDEALASLSAKSSVIDSEVICAIRTLKVEHWVYLRDTKLYSIFVHSSAHSAFAVIGLTDRIRDIVGGSGMVIETGIVRFSGRFVCDGLISGIVHLGRNYRESFNRTYRALKSKGSFHVNYEA